ncbi:MAG: hypothetical protein KGK01_04180 [Bradyrhizobium sp.]|uniref:hypothetical protein n=1 Tax=Bradyrhizobium sp. TaxID=376 RepID=UPI001C285872|nr:hypothetical protein [Bradyrhizobium sp.]MBU6463398.1 hypothetical protein [Pseudomonadota bacterium]MDE2067455.1 hypothetical protein [Bradyrhizobium sp.]MDE2241657.1 hypothetical protein [Bradyrhizobium sp.]MDE2471555.1 hypothetical protein [Bradyrhizobium sp.]
MIDSSALLHRASQLRDRAKHEIDEAVRSRLISMADHYEHLAESQNWSKAHPPDVSELSNLFTRATKDQPKDE